MSKKLLLTLKNAVFQPGGPFAGSAARALFVVLIVFVAKALLAEPAVKVSFDMKTTTGPNGELFYAAPTQGYASERRIAFKLISDGQWHKYTLRIPMLQRLGRLRIDPGTNTGDVALRKLSVGSGSGSKTLKGRTLAKALGVINKLVRLPSAAGELHFRSEGVDPYYDFAIGGAGTTLTRVLLGDLRLALALGSLWFALDLAATLLLAWLGRSRRARRYLDLVARSLSDDGVLRVDGRAVSVLACTALCALVYVLLGLNQSSISVWEELYPARAVDQLIELNDPKWVRSDEWNTTTPWVLDQVQSGRHLHNDSVGGANAALIASLPVNHLTAVAQVKYYGFALFDLETGFSWFWAYKTFGLLLSFFWLSLILTRGSVVASVLGAGWVYSSSFTQWWFSSHLPELLIPFALATVGLLYLLFAQRRPWIAAGAALLGFGVVSLPLHLYPPFILPLAYLAIVVVVGFAIEPGRTALLKSQPSWRLGALACALTAAGLLAGLFVADGWETLQAMSNTVYPGRRVSTSGGYPLYHLFYGFFESYRYKESTVPLHLPNACEASSFMLAAPVALLAIPFRGLLRRQSTLVGALLLYCFVVGLWVAVPLPHGLERLMQVAGFSWSPAARSLVGLGIGSILAVIVLFSRVQSGELPLRHREARQLAPWIVFACLLFYGHELQESDPTFFTWSVILAGSVAGSLVTAGAVLGHTHALLAGLILAAIPTMTVNPVVSGLEAVRDKPILLAARTHGGGPSDSWVVIGDFLLSQGLKTQGLTVLTGSQMVPNRRVLSVLDPKGQYEGVWNRYAHVLMASRPGSRESAFTLNQADLYSVSLDVCGAQLPALGVTRVAYTVDVPQEDLRCLDPLRSPTDSHVKLFRLRAAASGVSAP